MSDDTLRQDDRWDGTRNEAPGTCIGNYTLTRRLGEGGFGDVWEAAQTEPVKRHVALKILKLGMDTREVIARFDLERQALALMEHPHIARVLDAGATASGRPYFVMELVEGEPITHYCDQRALAVLQRLKLFAQVCTAVQHAHTKGIIHRDLKPGNVLVSSHEGEHFARVIDFGIAKAVSGELTDRSHATRIDQVIGTPLYMSPEQARGETDIDTRTDVYALGVILYELLTGSTPVERTRLMAASLVDTQRLICESEPPPPSVRLAKMATTTSGTAGYHVTQARSLAGAVRGELDWIVMKAIEKDRSRRYDTASALAADVQRYLDGEPVLAAPPGRAYRIGKFVRRNKVPVAAAVAVVLALVVGVVVAGWQAHVARQQEILAQRRAEQLEKVSHYQGAMLDQLDPDKAGKALTKDIQARYAAALAAAGVAEPERSRRVVDFIAQWQRINATDAALHLIDTVLLKPAATAIDSQFRDDPAVAATLRQALANRYAQVGLYDEAMPLQRAALEARRKILGSGAKSTLESEVSMGQLLDWQGHPDRAEPHARIAVAGDLRLFGPDHADTLQARSYLAQFLRDQGKYDQAEVILRDVLARQVRTVGAGAPDTLVTDGDLGGLLLEQGRPAQAEPFLRAAADGLRRANGEDDRDTLTAENNWGVSLARAGKAREAEALFRRVLDRRRHTLGDNHPDTLASMVALGGVLQDQGRFAEAEPLLKAAMEKRRRIIGEDAPETLDAIGLYGRLLVDEGRAAEAKMLLEGSLGSARKVLAEFDPPKLAFYLAALGKAHAQLHEFADARSELTQADAIVRAHAAAGDKVVAVDRELVALYEQWNRIEPGRGHDRQAEQWRAKMAAGATPGEGGNTPSGAPAAATQDAPSASK